MKHRLLPRLSAQAAQKRFEEITEHLRSGGSINDLVNLDPPEAFANPHGGQAATVQDLASCRSEVLRALADVQGTGKASHDEHGIVLGRALVAHLAPIPADAGHDGVWSFLSLFVFPDVVAMRWPADVSSSGGTVLSPDRWVGAQQGRDRNHIKWSWRRYELLGDIMESASTPLGEDEFVGLLERTAVARNRRLVRAAARAVASYDNESLGRMDFTRDLMRRVCYQTGARALDILSDQELDELVATCAEATIQDAAAVSASPRRAR